MHMLVSSFIITHLREEPDTGKVLDAAVHEIVKYESHPTSKLKEPGIAKILGIGGKFCVLSEIGTI